MMKCRAGGSLLSPILTGEKTGAISELRKKIIWVVNRSSGARLFASSHLKEDVSLKHSLNFTPDKDDDDFAELGAPLKRNAMPKLMTEKKEPLMLKGFGTKKASSSSSLPSEGFSRLGDVFLKASQSHSAPHLNGEKTSGNLVHQNASDCKDSTFVTIKDIPVAVHLSQLKEALSVFGKVSNAFMRKESNGLNCCEIEFESVDARNAAVSAGKIEVESFDLPVCPPPTQETIRIRIGNINSETADSVIHSICRSCAPLEGLVRKKEDAVDAFFRVKDESDIQCIVERLNNKTIDMCKWSANLQTEALSSEERADDGDSNGDALLFTGLTLHRSIKDMRRNLERRISLAEVHAEDLENLHNAILHLQCTCCSDA